MFNQIFTRLGAVRGVVGSLATVVLTQPELVVAAMPSLGGNMAQVAAWAALLAALGINSNAENS